MTNLTAHHLRFTLKAKTPIELDTHQGAAFRGMLFNALRGPNNQPALGFCTQRQLTSCPNCPLVTVCPVASLVATMDPQASRGRDLPRPYTIVPTTFSQQQYQPGQTFTFGLTLFGQALTLFPYTVMALRQAGPQGIGKRVPQANGRYLRGQFTLEAAQAINLLSGEVQDILEASSPVIQQPAMPVTHAQVLALSQQMLTSPIPYAINGGSGFRPMSGQTEHRTIPIQLHFKTPTRIINRKQLVKEPLFEPLFHRLLQRLTALSQTFSLDQTNPINKLDLLTLADQVELIAHDTHWTEVWSVSQRKGGKTPLSGFMGRATYQAPYAVWQHLLPYLLWGTVIHVGKNVVKGDGIFSVEVEPVRLSME